VEMARSLPFEVVLWTAQNIWALLHHSAFEQVKLGGRAEVKDAAAWTEKFLALGEQLQMHIAGVQATAG